MARFWSMVVDDEIANSQQIIKERPHRHNNKPNVNDAGEILLQSMLKIQLRDIASINAENTIERYCFNQC